VQFVLYIGTGFMTRDSVKILTDNDMREYFAAKQKYEELLEDLSDKRKALLEDMSHLEAYSRRAKRLIKSKSAAKKNIAQYNESARALIEARMSISVDPDLMEGMYDDAMKKEGRA
jgi:DNA repair ATPase RecN